MTKRVRNIIGAILVIIGMSMWITFLYFFIMTDISKVSYIVILKHFIESVTSLLFITIAFVILYEGVKLLNKRP